eukprot:1636667-Amphidinium_carterae.1
MPKVAAQGGALPGPERFYTDFTVNPTFQGCICVRISVSNPIHADGWLKNQCIHACGDNELPRSCIALMQSLESFINDELRDSVARDPPIAPDSHIRLVSSIYPRDETGDGGHMVTRTSWSKWD